MDEIAKFSRLVLMIEEAAVAPERWDPVVASIVEEIGATEGILFSPFLPPSLGGFWASRSIRPGHMEDYAAYYSDKDIWILAMKPEQLGTPGFVFRDDALIGHDTVRRSEFYNDFLRKLDIGRLLCGVVRSQGSAVPTGNIHLSVFRPMGKGGFSEHQQLLFQRLVPHLQAALKTHYLLRAGGNQAALAHASLNALALPVMLVNREARVLFANDQAREMFAAGDGLTTSRGTLEGIAARDTAALRSFIVKLFDAGESGARRWTLPIQRSSGQRPHVCFGHPLPLDVVGDCAAGERVAILFVHDPERQVRLEPDVLEWLYGITHAEALLAVSLVRGLSLKQAARARGVSYETARTQLKSLLRKTDCGNQGDLLKLLIRGAPCSRDVCATTGLDRR
jgi:DNA-binding CsgD family transcriptional regulator